MKFLDKFKFCIGFQYSSLNISNRKPLQRKNQACQDCYLLVVVWYKKVNANKLPVFCGNQLTIFRTLPSIHMYSTRRASSKNFYVQRTSLAKTNQSLKISGVKIWNSLPRHIKDKE